MKYLTFFLLLFSLTVNAEISTTGLTKAQAAELNLKAAEMKLARETTNTTPDVVNIIKDFSLTDEELDNISTYGTQLGKVLTGFVKEIGLTANEFLKTPWGIVVIVLLAWHLFASDIALIMMSFGVFILFYLYWNKLVAPALYTYIDIESKSDDKKSKLQKAIDHEELERIPGFLAIVGFLIFIIIEVVIMINIGNIG